MPRDERRLLVLGLMGQYPMAGVGWQALQYLKGLERLGFEVWYVEDSGAPPYDPAKLTVTDDPAPNVAFVRAGMERIGLPDRWIYWDLGTETWFGQGRDTLFELYRTAGSIWNLCGATRLRPEHHQGAKLVYVETDPVYEQFRIARGDPGAREMVEEHDVLFTYGENLGNDDCPVPLSGLDWHPTRPPVLCDAWEGSRVEDPPFFSTIATWENKGKDVEFGGVTYRWSKHLNFLHYLPVPARCGVEFEVAIAPPGEREASLLRDNGWRTVSPLAVSSDLGAYLDFIRDSRGEFTVAKDIYVRPNSGWFSDRSVCYLAAGRPVVTQESGFSKFVPSGRGLLSFRDLDEACAAVRAVNADYATHRAAARAIAREHFAAEKVLARMLEIVFP